MNWIVHLLCLCVFRVLSLNWLNWKDWWKLFMITCCIWGAGKRVSLSLSLLFIFVFLSLTVSHTLCLFTIHGWMQRVWDEGGERKDEFLCRLVQHLGSGHLPRHYFTADFIPEEIFQKEEAYLRASQHLVRRTFRSLSQVHPSSLYYPSLFSMLFWAN